MKTQNIVTLLVGILLIVGAILASFYLDLNPLACWLLGFFGAGCISKSLGMEID